MQNAQKGGVGTASIKLANEIVVGALVAVNAFGDVVEDGRILAGAQKKGVHIGTAKYILENGAQTQTMLGRIRRLES